MKTVCFTEKIFAVPNKCNIKWEMVHPRFKIQYELKADYSVVKKNVKREKRNLRTLRAKSFGADRILNILPRVLYLPWGAPGGKLARKEWDRENFLEKKEIEKTI